MAGRREAVQEKDRDTLAGIIQSDCGVGDLNIRSHVVVSHLMPLAHLPTAASPRPARAGSSAAK
jgi:hypothetical protein